MKDAYSLFSEQETQGKFTAFLRRHADQLAMDTLTRHACPPDLIEWGRRHGIENFAEVTWMAGFKEGWMAAVAAHAEINKTSDAVAEG